MNGTILEELPVAVDCFKEATNVQLYFLTHAHSDHTVGLTRLWKCKVHCTEVTAKLVTHRVGVTPKWFEHMKLQEKYTFKLTTKNGWSNLSVTALPANHCPGSCMFIFETDDMKILYTGDFKPNKKFYEIGKNIWGPLNRAVNVLYVDNTYADPACVLPPQKEALEEIVKLCKTHIDCTIFIGVYWTGHEDLLLFVSSQLGQLIVVTPEQLSVLRLISNISQFTTDKYESDIHAMPMHKLTKSFISEVSQTEKCIGIIPTGRLCDQNRSRKVDETLFYVPYSHHPSYTELVKFLQCVKPSRIRPVVQNTSSCQGIGNLKRADMSQFAQLLSRDHDLMPNFTCSLTQTSNDRMKAVQSLKIRRHLPTRDKKKRKTPKAVGVVFDED